MSPLRHPLLLYCFFDDHLSFGGGGGGKQGVGEIPSPDLDQRVARILAPAVSSQRVYRLLALVFAQPDSPLFKKQILPKLQYWHARSAEHAHLLCVGHAESGKTFSAALFSDSVRWLQARSGWEYSGNTDLVLLNARSPGTSRSVELQTNRVVAFCFEDAITDGAFRNVPRFMERLFSFAEAYHGDDPTWGFSDAQGAHLGASGLKAVLLAALPKSIRKGARSAFHFRVREHLKPAA